MPLGTDSTRLPPTQHHRLRPGVTCTPAPRLPHRAPPTASPCTAGRYVHDEHRDVVVLLVASEHTFNEVLEKPFRMAEHILIRACGHGVKFLKTRVETTISVLHQTIIIKNGSASRPQVKRVLLPRAGPAQRGARLNLIEPRRAACLKNKG